MKILVVNGGSSSFKFALFEAIDSFPAEPIWKKNIEFKNPSENREIAIKKALEEVPKDIDIIGHRIVHGGSLFQKPTPITSDVKKAIQDLSRIAPLHNPVNLEGVDIAEELFPRAKQMAVFDTAFHSTMPEVAWTYPGPWKWREEGIRRYGFHGISHQYCSERIEKLMKSTPKKLIVCHLGNGSSCTAISHGKSIDTSMGFTPMEGLMMGTRSGTVDPGILIYLQREKKLTVDEVDVCLNKQSGLLGVGESSDMREILTRANKQDPRAVLALNLYIYRLKQVIGALTASLDGLEVLCFTAGIGENASAVRQMTCDGLNFLGIKLDLKANLKCDADELISTQDSKVKVYVIHTREEWLIAKESYFTETQ